MICAGTRTILIQVRKLLPLKMCNMHDSTLVQNHNRRKFKLDMIWSTTIKLRTASPATADQRHVLQVQ